MTTTTTTADGADGLDSEIVATYFVTDGGGDVMERLIDRNKWSLRG